jgi:hypothetical protein
MLISLFCAKIQDGFEVYGTAVKVLPGVLLSMNHVQKHLTPVQILLEISRLHFSGRCLIAHTTLVCSDVCIVTFDL